MGTFDPLGRLQGLTLIMHCIKYVLNVSDEEWGPIYTIEASQQHLFLSQKGSDATVKRLRFFLSFYFFLAVTKLI